MSDLRRFFKDNFRVRNSPCQDKIVLVKGLGDPGDILYFLFSIRHDADISINSSSLKADSGANSQFSRQPKVILILNINFLISLTSRVNIELNNRNIDNKLSLRVCRVILCIVETRGVSRVYTSGNKNSKLFEYI